MATATLGRKTATATNSIAEKVVFLSIHFERFGNTRRVASSQVEVDADTRRVRVSKKLLASDALLNIVRHDHEIKRYIESVCLPYEKGIHAIPVAAIVEMDEQLRKYEARRLELIDIFIDEYPKLIEEAREPLGGLFKYFDFLTPQQARSEFRFWWNIVSFDTPGKLRDLNPQLFREENRKIGEKMEATYAEWRDMLRVAMADFVKRLYDSLVPGPDGKTRKMTDASVERLQEFLQTFSFRNVTNDAELEKLCGEVREIMTGVSAEQLRESERTKIELGVRLESVAKTLEVMTAGIRKIRVT